MTAREFAIELRRFVMWLLALVFLAMMLSFMASSTPVGRDDSDMPGWGGGRSGVRVRIDHATGCEYLEATSGGLVPRWDGKGAQRGCRP